MQCLEDWKQDIQDNFNTWLEELSSYDDIKVIKHDRPLDLYGFYEELCVLRTEFRKNARRNQDSFSTFGEALSGFEKVVRDISARILESEKEREAEDILEKKSFYLPLIEILERIKRIEKRFNPSPRGKMLSFGKYWREAWSYMEEGIGILRSHFEELLKKQGIHEIEALGRPFDPYLMSAVEVEETDEAGPNQVLNVISAGYYYRENILKIAEVKLSKKKEA